jgi:hypothetical protein
MITLWEVAGYLASGLVIAAFCMKDVITLRALALASNFAFLIYGIGLNLAPVWLLHAVLLPVNCWRLSQGIRRHVGHPAIRPQRRRASDSYQVKGSG